MDAGLLAAYLATDYRVRLPCGGWAGIRIGAALPAALVACVGLRNWAFVTAWNPYSTPQSRQHNRVAQHRLLAALRDSPQVVGIRAGLGTGSHWREPSLFVVGPGVAEIDALAQTFRQNAYVHGVGTGPAQLRLATGDTPHGQAG